MKRSEFTMTPPQIAARFRIRKEDVYTILELFPHVRISVRRRGSKQNRWQVSPVAFDAAYKQHFREE